MKITFLGTGTSTGVPTIGCNCAVCRSSDPKDKRLRCSSLLQINGHNILIDCGPDFRQQALAAGITRIDALLLTHAHYDHVGGIDDLRTVKGKIISYGLERTNAAVRRMYRYIFSPSSYKGSLPQIALNDISSSLSPFWVCGVKVVPILAHHVSMDVCGFRIGNFAYITDFKTIDTEEFEKLYGVEFLVMGMLRIEPHTSHLSLSEALALVGRLNPRVTYFVHMSHGIGFHADSQKLMPSNCHLAYDGLQVDF